MINDEIAKALKQIKMDIVKNWAECPAIKIKSEWLGFMVFEKDFNDSLYKKRINNFWEKYCNRNEKEGSEK